MVLSFLMLTCQLARAENATAPSGTLSIVWTKQMQSIVVAEAQAQLVAGDAARKAMGEGRGRARVEEPLEKAAKRWRDLPVSDLMKSQLSGCSEFASNTLGIAQEARRGRGDGLLAEKRRKFATEDRAACIDALKNPGAAFRAALELYPHVIVE